MTDQPRTNDPNNPSNPAPAAPPVSAFPQDFPSTPSMVHAAPTTVPSREGQTREEKGGEIDLIEDDEFGEESPQQEKVDHHFGAPVAGQRLPSEPTVTPIYQGARETTTGITEQNLIYKGPDMEEKEVPSIKANPAEGVIVIPGTTEENLPEEIKEQRTAEQEASEKAAKDAKG